MDDVGLLIAFALVAYLGCVSLFWKPRKKTHSSEVVKETSTLLKTGKPNPDEMIAFLNFMLANKIIDTKEYNQLMIKASKFL